MAEYIDKVVRVTYGQLEELVRLQESENADQTTAGRTEEGAQEHEDEEAHRQTDDRPASATEQKTRTASLNDDVGESEEEGEKTEASTETPQAQTTTARTLSIKNDTTVSTTDNDDSEEEGAEKSTDTQTAAQANSDGPSFENNDSSNDSSDEETEYNSTVKPVTTETSSDNHLNISLSKDIDTTASTTNDIERVDTEKTASQRAATPPVTDGCLSNYTSEETCATASTINEETLGEESENTTPPMVQTDAQVSSDSHSSTPPPQEVDTATEEEVLDQQTVGEESEDTTTPLVVQTDAQVSSESRRTSTPSKETDTAISTAAGTATEEDGPDQQSRESETANKCLDDVKVVGEKKRRQKRPDRQLYSAPRRSAVEPPDLPDTTAQLIDQSRNRSPETTSDGSPKKEGGLHRSKDNQARSSSDSVQRHQHEGARDKHGSEQHQKGSRAGRADRSERRDRYHPVKQSHEKAAGPADETSLVDHGAATTTEASQPRGGDDQRNKGRGGNYKERGGGRYGDSQDRPGKRQSTGRRERQARTWENEKGAGEARHAGTRHAGWGEKQTVSLYEEEDWDRDIAMENKQLMAQGKKQNPSDKEEDWERDISVKNRGGNKQLTAQGKRQNPNDKEEDWDSNVTKGESHRGEGREVKPAKSTVKVEEEDWNRDMERGEKHSGKRYSARHEEKPAKSAASKEKGWDRDTEREKRRGKSQSSGLGGKPIKPTANKEEEDYWDRDMEKEGKGHGKTSSTSGHRGKPVKPTANKEEEDYWDRDMEKEGKGHGKSYSSVLGRNLVKTTAKEENHGGNWETKREERQQISDKRYSTGRAEKPKKSTLLDEEDWDRDIEREKSLATSGRGEKTVREDDGDRGVHREERHGKRYSTSRTERSGLGERDRAGDEKHPKKAPPSQGHEEKRVAEGWSVPAGEADRDGRNTAEKRHDGKHPAGEKAAAAAAAMESPPFRHGGNGKRLSAGQEKTAPVTIDRERSLSSGDPRHSKRGTPPSPSVSFSDHGHQGTGEVANSGGLIKLPSAEPNQAPPHPPLGSRGTRGQQGRLWDPRHPQKHPDPPGGEVGGAPYQPPPSQAGYRLPLAAPPVHWQGEEAEVATPQAESTKSSLHQIASSERMLYALLQGCLHSDEDIRSMLDLSMRMAGWYRGVMLQDQEAANKVNLDQQLWKTCFYTPIDYLRRTMKDYSVPARLKDIILSLIEKGSGFYTELAEKTVDKFGLDLEMTGLRTAGVSKKRREHLGLLSVQKSYISLGDLARYQEEVKETTQFGKARGWYLKAQKVDPRNGHSYNQLALLAFKTRRKLDAVYYYMRSLAASNAFLTARESLMGIFEEARKRAEQSERKKAEEKLRKREERKRRRVRVRRPPPPSHEVNRVEIWVSHDGKHTQENMAAREESSDQSEDDGDERDDLTKLSTTDLNKQFVLSILNTHGKLFTKIGMESFGQVVEGLLEELRVLLSHSPSPLASARLLQLMAMNMFAIHNTEIKDAEVHGMQSLHQSQAVQVALDMFGLIAHRCSQLLQDCETMEDVRANEDLHELLPSVKIWTDWMCCHPSLWNPPPNSPEYTSPLDIWSAVADLCNLLSKVKKPAIDIRKEQTEGYVPVILEENSSLYGFVPLHDLPLDVTQPGYLPPPAADRDLAEAWVRMECLANFADYACGLEVNPPLDWSKAKGYFSVTATYVQQDYQEDSDGPRSPSQSSDEAEGEAGGSHDGEAEEGYHGNQELLDLKAKKDQLLEQRQREEKKQEQIKTVLVEQRVRLTQLLIQPVYLVPDTNCFIDHLQYIQQLVFSKRYILVVPLIVITELDGLSKGGRQGHSVSPSQSSWVQQTSAHAVLFLEEQFEAGNKNVRALTSKGNEMTTITFRSEESHNKETNDDIILSCCLHYCEDKARDFMPANKDDPIKLTREVVLLTNDRNLRVKAYSRNVPARNICSFIGWANLKQ